MNQELDDEQHEVPRTVSFEGVECLDGWIWLILGFAVGMAVCTFTGMWVIGKATWTILAHIFSR